MSDVLKKTFKVNVALRPGEPEAMFTFLIPSIKFDIEVSYKAADIRRRAYPPGAGLPADADQAAYMFSRYAAYMELYLQNASEPWVFSKDKVGAPVVNFETFPPEYGDAVYQVGAAFDEAYTRFRRGGDIDKRSPGTEAVDSQPDSGAS